MTRLRGVLAVWLSAGLVCASTPARALQSAIVAPVKGVAAPVLVVPVLPALPEAKVPNFSTALDARAVAVAPVATQMPTATAQLQALEPAAQRPTEQASGRIFDGGALKNAASVAALPIAAVKVPSLGLASYTAANALSFVFPLPQIYKTYKQGHARDFPVVRAALGALGTILLGLVNATVLDKPFWGAMHIFVGLGMVAPYFIGKALERRGAGERAWLAPEGARGLAKLWARIKGDGAFRRTMFAAVPMLAGSAGLYALSAAFVPAALATALAPAAMDAVLLGLQLFKFALFLAVFLPDVGALIKGEAPKGFTLGFNLAFFASVAAFTAWGFTAAAGEAPGPIRDQYLILAARNLGESIASALSIAAIWRAARVKPPAAKK